MKKHIIIKKREHTQLMVALDDIKSMQFLKVKENQFDTYCKIIINDKFILGDTIVSDKYKNKDEITRDAKIMYGEFDQLANDMEEFVFGVPNLTGKSYLLSCKMIVEMWEKNEKLNPNIATVQIVVDSNAPHPKIKNSAIKLQGVNLTSVFDVEVEYTNEDSDKNIIDRAINILKEEFGCEDSKELMVEDSRIIDRDEGAIQKSFIRYWFER
jgi:hypothetical protein